MKIDISIWLGEEEVTFFYDLISNPFKVGDVITIDVDEWYPVEFKTYTNEFENLVKEDTKKLKDKFKYEKIKLTDVYISMILKVGKETKLKYEYQCEFVTEEKKRRKNNMELAVYIDNDYITEIINGVFKNAIDDFHERKDSEEGYTIKPTSEYSFVFDIDRATKKYLERKMLRILLERIYEAKESEDFILWSDDYKLTVKMTGYSTTNKPIQKMVSATLLVISSERKTK